MKNRLRHKSGQRGIAVLEFTLASLVLIPLLLGTFVFGFKLIRALQMQQITRDIGHMYVRGINFRAQGSIQVAQSLASAFDLTSAGTSEVILSKVSVVQQADCDAGNPGSPGLACSNLNQPTFIERLTLGNSGLSYSVFGTPPLQSDQTVSAADRANTGSAQANGFGAVLTLKAGEVAYVAEMVNYTPDLNFTGAKPLIYARSIF